jgi:hypothetical protein
MPFGLTNAPAAFQRFMNDIFSNMVNICVVIYLNDILSYSNNINIHRTHVQEVLRRFRKNGLFAGALSTPTPSTILVTFYLQQAYQWTLKRSKPSKIGQNLVM